VCSNSPLRKRQHTDALALHAMESRNTKTWERASSGNSMHDKLEEAKIN
jgi:hypothetical protein